MSLFSERTIQKYYESSKNYESFLEDNKLVETDDIMINHMLKMYWEYIFVRDETYVLMLPNNKTKKRAKKLLKEIKKSVKAIYKKHKDDYSTFLILTENENRQLQGRTINKFLYFVGREDIRDEIRHNIYCTMINIDENVKEVQIENIR